MADAARLAEEVKQEQDHSAHVDRVRKGLEMTIRDLQLKMEEAEQAMIKCKSKPKPNPNRRPEPKPKPKHKPNPNSKPNCLQTARRLCPRWRSASVPSKST